MSSLVFPFSLQILKAVKDFSSVFFIKSLGPFTNNICIKTVQFIFADFTNALSNNQK